MNAVDRYVQDALRNVFANREDRERLEADLRHHFAEGEKQGKSPDQILLDMGSPQDVAAAFNAERPMHYAGFWKRTVAFAGDLGFLAWLNLPMIALLLFITAGRDSEAGAPILWLVALLLLGLSMGGTFLLYFPVLEARFGKTLGKHLLRIRVVHESGTHVSWGQAFLRRLSMYFEFLFIDALFIPFTEKRQRALDIVAKTVVANEHEEKAAWWSYALCLLALPVLLLIVFCVVQTPFWIELQ